MRSEERADIAAHLHDSVLQTLALIQRSAERPGRGRPAGPRARSASCGVALRRAAGGRTRPRWRRRCAAVAAEVEDAHGVPVEVVVVGDRRVDRRGPRRSSLAAREAMVNAAKHSGAARSTSTPRSSPTGGRGVRPRPRRAASTPTRSPTTGTASQQHRRPHGAPRRHRRRCAARPARAPRSGSRSITTRRPRRPHEPAQPSSSSTTTPCSAPVCAPSSAARRRDVVGEAGRRRRGGRGRASAHQPDVVLLDVHLPDGGGAEVLRTYAGQAARAPGSSRCRCPTRPRT